MTKKETIKALKAVNVERLSITDAHDQILEIIEAYVDTLTPELFYSSDELSEPLDRDFWPPDEVCDYLIDVLRGCYDQKCEDRLVHVVNAVADLTEEEDASPLYYMSPYETYFRPVTRQDILDWRNRFIKALEELKDERTGI